MKQKIKRRISSLICFVMVLSMLVQNSVQTVWAWPGNPGGTVQSMGDAPESEELSVTDDVSAEDGTFEAAEVLQEESEEPVILHEIEENRGEFSKEYLRSDNSRMLIVYPQQIHFEAEDGSLVEIDNSLIKTEEGYRNGSNSYDVFISDNADSQGKVCYKEGNYEISWQMVEIVEETTEQDSKQDDSSEKKNKQKPDKDNDNGNKDNKKEHKKEKQKHKKGIHKPQLDAAVTELAEETPLLQEDEAIHQMEQSKVTFDGYSNGVSVEYEPMGDGVKENIILSSMESGNEYIFNVQMAGLKARLNSANEIEFYDENTDEIMYYFPAPFMIDNEGKVSYGAKYELVDMSEELAVEEEVPEEETTPEPDPQPAPEPDSGDVSDNESVTEPEPEPQPQPEEGSVSENESAPEPTPDWGTVSENALSIQSMAEIQPDTVSGSDNDTDTVSGNETGEESETPSETSPETSSESEPDISAEPDTSEKPDTSEEPDTSNESDASNEPSDTFAPDGIEEGIYIKIVLDEAWLAEAAYPVKVDPVLKQARAKNLVDSGSIASDETKYDTLYVGKKDDNVYRSFVRFELPKMEKQSIVSEAILYLNGTVDSANKHYIQAHMVTEEWYNTAEEASGKALSWSNQPAIGSVLDYTVNASYFNITKAVRNWQSGDQKNFGIAFTAYDESVAKRDTIRLKDGATSPYLKITYRTAVGLESYWGTHATGAGSAGAGYVNDYTGALTVINTDVVTAGNRFPMSIGHVYNSNDTEDGNGWRLNYQQTIKIPLDTVDITTYPYVYTDQDGTEHYFKKSGVTYLLNGASKEVLSTASVPPARDEDGLNLYIVPVSDAELKEKYPLKLIDQSGSLVRYFDTMGRLAMITDSNQYENGKNSDTKEKNAVIINYETCGEAVDFTAYDDAIAAAQAFRDLCYTSGITTDSAEYTEARDKTLNCINVLKTDPYATANYATAKQVNTAAVQMSNLTDTTGTVSKTTAKTTSNAILTALTKAKTLAEPFAADSSKRISSVTDAVGNEAVFTYDTAGNISTISDPTYEGGKVNRYFYDAAGNLTQITFASGKNAYYTYAEDHLLTVQRDHDGYKVEYTYSEPSNRIVKVAESHSGTPGQTYSITYNTDNTSTFRFSGVDDAYGTDDDIENVHVFDEQGRAICIYSKAVGEDKVLGATACTYEVESSDDVSKRNKIKDTAVVGMHTNNLLVNHSFEYDDDNWTLYKNVDETPESGALNARSTTRKYLGSYGAYANMAKRKDGIAGFKQEVELEAGTYTFSGYCRAVSIANTAAYLKVTDAAGNNYYSNKITEATKEEFDNGWTRLEVTFTIPTDQTVTVYLENDCGTTKGAGNVAFDCVQLEAGNTANDYNILEDGSFELTEDVLPYKWKNVTGSTITTPDTREEGGVDGDYCYHITGQPGKDKYLRVSPNLGSAKNSFVLSGWVKTNTTPIRSGRNFKVYAYHREETETTITELKISSNLNAYSEGWKYFCVLLPAANWKDTSITIQFYDNIGDLYIDGLQLTRNDVQTRTYNSAGKLTSSYTTQKSTDYSYDTYGRRKKQTTPSGASMSYTYKNNDVTKIADSVGPDTFLTYDKYGNQLSSSAYDPEATKRQEYYSETTYTEDGNFKKTSTDNAGNVTSYEYNTLTGQMTRTTQPLREGVDEEAITTHYIYDSEDRISGVTQGERSIGYEYGEFDDLTGINHNGFSYNYTYDNFGNVLTAAIAGNVICTNEYAPYNGGLVRSVYPDGTYTGTTYDEYGKVTSNSLNGVTMTKYVYDNDGNVAKKTDAIGGITTKYDYNDSGLLVRSEVYNGDSTASEDFESRMQYTYTKSGEVGNLSYQEKDGEVHTYIYTYDKDNKPVKSILPDGSYTTWSFDSLRRNNKAIYVPKDGASDGKKLYTILEYKDVTLTTADGTEKSATTGMVSTYTNKFGSSGDPVSKFSYTYDEWGNITEIQGDTELSTPILYEDPGKVAFGTTTQSAGTTTQSTSTEASVESTRETDSVAPRINASTNYAKRGERSYTYNEYSEVTKATETYSNGAKYTYDYVYDNGGNILTETVSIRKANSGTVSIGIPVSESENVTTETHTYVYDEVWKDKLISYDGKTITYDEFGCPIDYMDSAMTWDIYGSLTSVDNGTDTITYTYMGDGQRRSKTVNGVTTTYHYNNGMLLSETTGDETLRYYYDSTGKVASVIYQKGDGEETGYFYTRNVQGDIIAIYRSSDSTLVGTYEYDLWGKIISIATAGSNADPDGILEKNPFRYRGYYYDNETGFYNLNARYYDPEIRRFISGDSMSVLMIATVSLDCKNLFAYSENNPITGKDSSGGVAETVFDVASLSGSVVDVCCNPKDPWAWAGLVGDVADLIPFVTGLGEGVKGLRILTGAAELADDIHDAGKTGEAIETAVEVANKTNKSSSLPMEMDLQFFGKANDNDSLKVGEYLAGKASTQVTPGIRYLDGQYLNDLGEVQPWKAYYDEFGRLIARTDYNAGNIAQGIPDIHYHLYEWGAGKNPFEYASHIAGEYIP